MAVTEKAPTQPAHTNRKCCGKCAFRPGSQERGDPYGLVMRVEDWQRGLPFYCHESVPGHYQEERDDRPRWRGCAGWAAHRETGFKNAIRMIGVNPDADTVYWEGAENG